MTSLGTVSFSRRTLFYGLLLPPPLLLVVVVVGTSSSNSSSGGGGLQGYHDKMLRKPGVRDELL